MDPCGNLVVIADRTEVYDLLKTVPATQGDIQLFFCGKGEDIPAFLKANGIRIAILDVDDPPAADLELLKRLKKLDPRLTAVVVGPPAPPDEIMEWIELGASDVLARPLEAKALGEALRKILEKCALRRETFLLEKRLEKKYVFHGIVSKSPAMYEVFGQMGVAAETGQKAI